MTEKNEQGRESVIALRGYVETMTNDHMMNGWGAHPETKQQQDEKWTILRDQERGMITR